MIDIELRCKKCTRFLGIKGVETIIAQVRCPSSKCKELNNIKVVTYNATEQQLNYRFPSVKPDAL